MKSFKIKSLVALLFAGLLVSRVIPTFADAITITVDSAGGYFTSLELNSDGFPVISYYDVDNGTLKIAVCGNASCTADNSIASLNSGESYWNSLALSSNGTPVISYHSGFSSGPSYQLKVVACGNSTCTSGNTINIVDGSTGVGRNNSLVLNSSNFPVISYYDAINGDLKIAVCGNTTCSAGNTITIVDSDGAVGLYTSLALNSSGFPIISYYDGTNGDLKVAICGNATCSTGNTITTVDGSEDVGRSTSLALNSSGFPVIGYYDATNEALKIAVCGDAFCTAGNTIATIDNAGDIDQDVSLALNSSDIPIISYYDDINGDMKVAVCGNTTCTAGNKIAIVDSDGDVGWFTSLALNESGVPVISYYDVTNNDLKVAAFSPPSVVSTNLGSYSITVTFSENVYDPPGDEDPDDVTNSDNYFLVEAGENWAFETISCAEGLAGDDARIIVASINYIPNTATVNLSNSLPAGRYRLFVCGTTSIMDGDLALLPLGGGNDFIFDFAVDPPPPTYPTFADVPVDSFGWAHIESIYAAGITGGCMTSPLNYCPNNPVTRAQMAIFLLRGIHGSGYAPAAPAGDVFSDVPSTAFAAAWIEQLFAEGITGGCGGGNYCPNNPVTRAQMAIFLLRAKYGSDYTPPPPTGVLFDDIPTNAFAAAWIEQLAAEGITSGCGGGNYCPNNTVTRAQMAVFIQKTFALPLPQKKN